MYSVHFVVRVVLVLNRSFKMNHHSFLEPVLTVLLILADDNLYQVLSPATRVIL